jgi:hypothetical protein
MLLIFVIVIFCVYSGILMQSCIETLILKLYWDSYFEAVRKEIIKRVWTAEQHGCFTVVGSLRCQLNA